MERIEAYKIINTILFKLKKDKIDIKLLTNILFLVEWKFIEYTDYRLFNIKWSTDIYKNALNVKNFLERLNIELIREKNSIYIYLDEEIGYTNGYIKKSIDMLNNYSNNELVYDDDIELKSDNFFLSLLPINMFKKHIDNNFEEFDILELFKSKKSKVY